METTLITELEKTTSWLKDYGIIVTDEIAKTNTSKIYRAELMISEQEPKCEFTKEIAVKVSLFPYWKLDSVWKEDSLLSKLHHENIICPINFGKYVKSPLNPETEALEDPQNAFIITEFMAWGDLLDVINTNGSFTEDAAKDYFKQILSAVKYLHSEGIIHRDIKLQNVILNNDNKVQLIDFGFASDMNSDSFTMDSDKVLINSKAEIKGTQGYISPEMLDAQQKIDNFLSKWGSRGDAQKGPEIKVDLKMADIFSLGVLLFEMVIGISPFLNANAQDSCYRYFYFKKRESQFWKIHPKARELDGSGKLSEEFKNLVERILTPFVKDRPTIEEIEAHPWMTS